MPSCFDCKKAKVSAGFPGSYWEPPEPAEATCEHQTDDEGDEDFYERCAERCGKFDPIPVWKCGACKKDIDSPAFSWNLRGEDFYSMEPVPACSPECQTVLKLKFDKEAG